MLFLLYGGSLHASVTQAHGQTFIFIHQERNFLPRPPSTLPAQCFHIILDPTAALYSLFLSSAGGSSVCQLSIHIVTDPIRHVARCDFIFPSININWEIYHPLKHLSTFIQTVKNNDCCQISLPKRPFSHYWLLSWDAITKQKNQPIKAYLQLIIARFSGILGSDRSIAPPSSSIFPNMVK